MNQKRYAVIGHPIGHTMSPFIHKRLFELSGIDASYEVFNIPPHDLGGTYPSLRALDGYNITIPHKRSIIPYLDALDKKAALYGSVNTVKNGETTEGFTTDADGFLMALRGSGIPHMGKVVILGAGGAGRTMAFVAALAGYSTVIAVRPSSLRKAARLAGDICSNAPHAQVNTCLISRLEGHIDLLANATPCGMYPNTGEMPVSEDLLCDCSYVFDAIYNPRETLLLKKAREHGAKTIGGLSMLVWQAVAAHKIWDGSEYAPGDIEQLLKDTALELDRQFSGE